MMETLSDKIWFSHKFEIDSLDAEDVKEFLRQLKKKLKKVGIHDYQLKEIDKLAGDKLT